MSSLNKKEIQLLYKYASHATFIIETGSGQSTEHLAHIIKRNRGLLVSIDIDPKFAKHNKDTPHFKTLTGWSISYKDLIKPGHPQFIESRYTGLIDGKVVFEGPQHMYGETDLIRKVIKEHDQELDFFFCDTGEYCGLAEWNVIKDLMAIGGIIVCHDIYYPKSIKCFQVLKAIKDDTGWELVEELETRKGLCVGRKISD